MNTNKQLTTAKGAYWILSGFDSCKVPLISLLTHILDKSALQLAFDLTQIDSSEDLLTSIL